MTISANSGRRWRLAEIRRVRDGSLPDHSRAAAPKAIPCRQTPPPSFTAKFPWPPCLVRRGGRLIANARLEFPATRRKQSTATKSNRERMAISCLSFSLFSGPEPQASSLHNPWPPCRGRLIVTPRLEFCATRTKQSSSSTSNRYKMHFSPPCCLAATRFTRYNSGSHIEVNQL
jgi:hypothetical protein